MASKLSPQQADELFYQSKIEIREKRNIFTLLLLLLEKTRDIGMGPIGEMMFTYRATNALLTKSGCGAVFTVFCLPEVGRCW